MTGRLPFRARDTRAADAAPQPPASAPAETSAVPLRVSALAAMIDGALRSGLPARVRVLGEVSGFRERTHWYFDLKDAGAVVSCVLFASSARRAGFLPADGQEVVVSGRVEFYGKAGKVSLIATSVTPVGAGAADLALKRLVDEIRALGWLDPERKRPLPVFPGRIAVVTSRSGAALQDVLDTLRRRCPAVGVLVADARVQGDAAARELTATVRELGRRALELGLSAILVTRGGGSAEDLWAFNDRELARAIVESPLPVVAAIGHETDTTIAELVADARAATPTQAAVLLAPDAGALQEQIASRARRLVFSAQGLLTMSRRRLTMASDRPVIRRPAALIEPQGERLSRARSACERACLRRLEQAGARLDRAALRLSRARPDIAESARMARRSARLASARAGLSHAASRRLHGCQNSLEALSRQLEAVSPLAVLRRGYTVTLDAQGRVLRSVADAPAGSSLETRLVDGSVRSVVGGQPDRTRAPRPRRREDPGQFDLFNAGG